MARREADTLEPWTADKVLALLEARHPDERGEWAFFPNIRTFTGYGRPGSENYLDALAFACWPSSGFTRIAYEIKVARSDWLHETRKPEKRAAAMALSHEFFFVAPCGVVKDGEVPQDCGLLEATAAGLRTKKAAPRREAKPLPVDFVASLLRAADRQRRDRQEAARARVYKFKGREITADELLEIAHEEHGRWLEATIANRAETKARELTERQAEVRLAREVARVMGPLWGGEDGKARWHHVVPSPEQFRAWAAAQMGDAATAVPTELRRSLRALAESARHVVTGLEEAAGSAEPVTKR